ncbi:hypothetical protein [Rhodoplanes sp. Z2-YC6860]|uniref:hypothetical protein n=1 Tax=Rhodoplanes sp. Z2-YC6860 TaxID=674703 RepID=UPI0012EE6E6C|nr:hypothetical protein [Rhodoplanes sp. Z2-YC6860]
MTYRGNAWIKFVSPVLLGGVMLMISPAVLSAQSSDRSAPPKGPSVDTLSPPAARPNKGGIQVPNDPTGATEIKAAQTLTTKVLAIGTWTAKATPDTRPPIMPSEARDTMRLMLAGKIDQWFAKIDGSGAVFLMNVTNPAEAHALLEALPLGKADMMTFELIPVGPLWPLGLLLREPAK